MWEGEKGNRAFVKSPTLLDIQQLVASLSRFPVTVFSEGTVYAAASVLSLVVTGVPQHCPGRLCLPNLRQEVLLAECLCSIRKVKLYVQTPATPPIHTHTHTHTQRPLLLLSTDFT